LRLDATIVVHFCVERRHLRRIFFVMNRQWLLYDGVTDSK
jgi:hypothetical protein